MPLKPIHAALHAPRNETLLGQSTPRSLNMSDMSAALAANISKPLDKDFFNDVGFQDTTLVADNIEVLQDIAILYDEYEPEYSYMHAGRKIIKPVGQSPDKFEELVAQELFNLEVGASEMKEQLRGLNITGAKQIDISGGGKAIIVFVPFKQHAKYQKIQENLVRELEKKLSGSHVMIIAQRTILNKSFRRVKTVSGPRRRSRNLTQVQEAILEDLVYPTEIVGKRARVRMDNTKVLKVLLDPKDQVTVETKLDTFAQVYKKLTSKDVVFEFPTATD